MLEDLTQKNIIDAIESFSTNGGMKDTQYGVWFHGKTYSPAGLISEAYRLKKNPIDRRSFTTDVAQKRLLQLGFPIVENNHDFFSEKELKSFSELVYRPSYNNADIVDKNIGDFLSQVVWEKTIFWANKLRDLGWVIEGSRHWNEQDRNGQRYKKYTWLKVYPKDNRHDLLFFTIGVDSDGFLLYKLDIKEKDPFFTQERKSFFKTKREELKVGWQRIHFEELEKYNWDKLIDISHQFFTSHLEHYQYFVDFFWSDKGRLMRLTWNENNWEFPSGHKWSKSNQGDTSKAYENQYGYGHEEWLFNERYRIGEYQYGYIRGIDQMSENELSIKKIILFTINPYTKERFLVGELNNVQIVEGIPNLKKEFEPTYKKHYNEMVVELKEVKADYEHFISEGLFPNIRFKWEDRYIYSNPIQSKFLESDKFKRFQPYKLDSEIEKNLTKEIEVSHRLIFQAGKASSKDSYSKTTSGKKTQVNRSHTKITDDLYEYLIEIKGFDQNQVSVEKTKIGGACIDVAVKEDDLLTIWEAKTCHVALQNIRLALGQIFEYAFFDDEATIKQLIIVGPAKLNHQEKCYFEKIKSIINVPLSYWAYDSSSVELKGKFIEA